MEKENIVRGMEKVNGDMNIEKMKHRCLKIMSYKE